MTGRPGVATGDTRAVKRAGYALWKNPENLTEHRAARLARVAKTDPRLYRAYLLKEGLRHVFAVKGAAGKEALERWVSWARRCRIPAFVELARKIVKHREAIHVTLDCGLSNALIESTNTKIRLLTRITFAFRSPQALIAVACSPSAATDRPPRAGTDPLVSRRAIDLSTAATPRPFLPGARLTERWPAVHVSTDPAVPARRQRTRAGDVGDSQARVGEPGGGRQGGAWPLPAALPLSSGRGEELELAGRFGARDHDLARFRVDGDGVGLADRVVSRAPDDLGPREGEAEHLVEPG